jgi:uncharacterized iron-regulated membrane protein
MARVARRWLYLIHRWVGIASCLLFAMWFASGLVMIYVPYPSLSPAQRLAGVQAIDWAAVDVPPPGGALRGLVLEMRDGVPVWRVTAADGTQSTLAAHRGAVLPPVDAALARRVAGRFGHGHALSSERLMRDQWSVAGGFDRHRPLWKVSLDDPVGTQLYVSSATGNVVQATTAHARFWNWLGSVPHWLYPTVLRQDNAAWRQVVMWVSGPCIAAALAGMWIGILRTRVGARRFKGGRMTPYHGWMLWHHVAGMVGGLFLLAWIVSGWLSVDPWHLFRGGQASGQAERTYAAGVPLGPIDLGRLARAAPGARRVEMTAYAGQRAVSVFGANGTRQVFDPASWRPLALDQARVARAAAVLVPGGHLVAAQPLFAPDAYWYAADGAVSLPVWRLRFDDAGRTWLHVDPQTGAILGRMDSRRRLYRWLFDLLHTWDVNWLTTHRPLWDLWLWALSAFGLVTSVSGVWLGWKRLRKAQR